MADLKFCPLFSGSNGNSIFVSYMDSKILFDCGCSYKKIKENLSCIGEDISEIDAVFISHFHTDHTSALPMILKNTKAKVCATYGTLNELFIRNEKMSAALSLYKDRVFQIDEKEDINFGDFIVSAFSVPHDAEDTVGYNLISEEKSISILTDIGFLRRNLYEDVRGKDLVFIESNHDVWSLENCSYTMDLKRRILSDGGHLSNENCGKFCVFLAKEGVKRFILGHLSGEANTTELAYETVKDILTQSGITPEKDVELWVSPRGELGKVVVI